MSRSGIAFILAGAVCVLDQATKQWATLRLEGQRSVEMIPGFFSLTLVHNTGAAWGMFKDRAMGLTLLAGVALLFLVLIRRHFTYVGLLSRIAFGLLLGGILGNLTDRLIYGHVIDFLSFYFRTYQWPVFNVADSAICIGVGLYFWDTFKKGKSEALQTSLPAEK